MSFLLCTLAGLLFFRAQRALAGFKIDKKVADRHVEYLGYCREAGGADAVGEFISRFAARSSQLRRAKRS